MSLAKKYKLYVYVKPYDLKLCLLFPTNSKIRFIQEYVEDTMRNFRTRYKVGRIEQKKTSSILLPDFKIGEILEDNDELIVYSIEYGLTKKSLNDKSSLEDIDKLFIAKKTRRESKGISRKISIDKNEKNQIDNYSDGEKNEDNDSDDEENGGNNKDDNGKNDNDDNKEDDDSIEKKEKKNNKNKVIKNENSSDSGDDKSEDINL